MAMIDITELMEAYRECARNLWNVYFSRRKDVGASLDVFEQIRELLFESLVVGELSYGEQEGEGASQPALRVVPRSRSLLLIRRSAQPGESGYWDEEKDLVVSDEDVTLGFVDYFDFSQVPIKDFRYYRCKVLRFPSRSRYVGRDALLEVIDAKVFHDEQGG